MRALILILAGVLATPAPAGELADAINGLSLQLQFEGQMQRLRQGGGGGGYYDGTGPKPPYRKAELYCQDRIRINTEADRPEYERCLRHMTEWFAR